MMSSLKYNQEKLGKLGSKVLGVGWNPSTDNLNLNFSISLVSKKEKTITTVSKENFLAIGRDLLTPKNLPRITKRLHIVFINIFRSVVYLNWDIPLPKDHQNS